MFELKPDFDDVFHRFEAWWQREIVDRPMVGMTFPAPETARKPFPVSSHATLRDRWLDTEYRVAATDTWLGNTVHVADSLPIAWPNLGPEIFSAFYGCELEFGEDTVWSKPILKNGLEEPAADALRLDKGSFYFRKLVELTEAFIEKGKNRFMVGYTDLHGGGDAIAAFLDPQTLLLETLEHPEAIKRLCDRITTDFLDVYDQFHERLSAAGMPSTTWLGATCKGKFHVPSNDFSCMISEQAFEDLFIPGIIRECRHMDRCIYHLDGPQALRFLDRLLDIPDIHAIQWVPGAGHDDWAEWIPVYQRIQNGKKAVHIHAMPAGDLELLFKSLAPEGVWIHSLTGITNREEANAALHTISKWTRKQ